MDQHLHDNQFPSGVIKEYIQDIFGWCDSDGTVHEGLVYCCSADDFNKLHLIKEKWDDSEKVAFVDRKQYTPHFHTWFMKHKTEIFCDHTLRSLQEDVGLGSPPRPFYTNDNESVNALLKECVAFKKQQWPVFNSKVKKYVNGL